MAKDAPSQVAYCADYDSDEAEEVASTRRLATGPSTREQANITVKRTADAQGSASSSPRQNSQDLASDSGYSSRTHGTSASADSGKSATPRPPVVMDVEVATAAVAGSPSLAPAANTRPALSRTSSKSSRKPKQCADPTCDKCLRGRMMKRSTNSSQKSASKSPSKRAPPTERTPSTNTKRSSEMPAQPAAAQPRPQPQPQARPPLRSSSTSRARPRSMYDAPNVPQSAGAGPPVAYWNAQCYPYQAQGYTTGAGNMMVAERPGMPHRATDTAAMSARRRPTSIVGPPVVSYDLGAAQRLSARRPTKTTYPVVGYEQDEDEEATGESEEYDSPEDYWNAAFRQRQNEFQALEARKRAEALQREEAARRMPPPSQPASASGQQKYSMRSYDKAATRITYGDCSDYYDDGVRDTARGFDPNFLSIGSSRPRRSSLASSGDRSKYTSSSQPIAGTQRVTIEDPQRPRRQSYVGNEDLEELIAKHFDSSWNIPTLRHKRGSSDFAKTVDPDLSDALRAYERDDRPTRYDQQGEAALAYQRKTDRLRTPEPASLTAKNVRRHAGFPSEDDEPLSPARTNVSNDGSARYYGRRQIKALPSERPSAQEGEVRMRVDLSNDFELEFEGRRVAIAPTGEGSVAELVISSKRDSTSYYGTSKGSLSTESRLGRRDSARGKQPATPRTVEREPPTPTRFRREQPERDDDERSTTTTTTNVSRRGTRTKRAETYAASSSRRAAEEEPSEYETSKAARPQHRRTKTQDARYDAGPSSPVSSKSKKSPFGRF